MWTRLFSFSMMLFFVLGTIVTSVTDSFADEIEPNILSNKKALFIGDSITYGWDNAGGENGGWVTRIQKLSGMQCVNAGVQGARVSHTRTDKKTIVNQLSASNGDYDLIVMHGGVNDVRNNIPIGEITENGDTDYRVRRFGGALEDMFSKAKSLYPNTDLFFILNFRLDGDQAKMGYQADMGEYFALAEQICEKWGVTVIDLYHNAELNEKLECTTTKYLYDMLHPNAAGYDIITPYILNALESYYAASEPTTDTENSTDTETDFSKSEKNQTVDQTKVPSANTEKQAGCASSLSIGGVIFGSLMIAVGSVISVACKKKRR